MQHPLCCPNPLCPDHLQRSFSFQRRGSYRRASDRRIVARFMCTRCGKFFSEQTFQLSFRLKRPELTLAAFWAFVSKVTHRQTARQLGCTRKTIRHRLALLGRHCRDFHRLQLPRMAGAIEADFELDELETFEEDRRFKPLTVPVLIHTPSWMVLDLGVAPLSARGMVAPPHLARRARLERREGRRRSGSDKAVEACFGNLPALVGKKTACLVRTDKKDTYGSILKRALGERLVHVAVSSKARRDTSNPLFRINVTLAMARDGISRLVRRTWAHSKQASWLELHLWVWAVYRSYVRAMVNRTPRESSASRAGLYPGRLNPLDLLGLRAIFRPELLGIRARM